MKMFASKKMQVFISYRREKGGIAYAHILNEKLSELGIDCFFDMRSMVDYSKDFEIKIKNNIENSEYIIVLLQEQCFTERENIDYFLQEIRYAISLGKELLLLPIGNDFIWENEKNLPSDLEHLSKLNLCTTLKIGFVTECIQSLLNKMNHDDSYLHYLLLLKMQNNSSSQVNAPMLLKSGNISQVNIENRWNNAVRVSLMAVGCYTVIHRFTPLIKTKAESGTQFRFLSIDPEGHSASDFIANKINSSIDGVHDNYLKRNCDETIQILEKMDMEKDKISYRLTSDHITFTMHWVECKNDFESYMYIEYLPIHASEILQDSHCATIIQRNDPTYEFYANQFNECWRGARIALNSTKPSNCEFCFPAKENDKYILLDTNYWRIYLANNQNYPGRCIIPLRRHCENLSDISERELHEFHKITKMLEEIWRTKLEATNFNWTCLMNGGYSTKPYIPHVHFHFIPRFDHPYKTSTGDFIDATFGQHYVLSDEYQLDLCDREHLYNMLREAILEYWCT